MSRTYRKNDYTDSISLKQHLARDLVYWKKNPYRIVRTRKTDAQLKADNLWADKEYDCEIKELAYKRNCSREKARGIMRHCLYSRVSTIYLVRRNYVSEFTSYYLYITKEEAIKESIAEYKSYNRDGKYHETTGNEYFKYLNKREVRSRTRRMIHQIKRGEEWTQPYPADYLGKKHFWSVW